jgi:hypothetical protein
MIGVRYCYPGLLLLFCYRRMPTAVVPGTLYNECGESITMHDARSTMSMMVEVVMATIDGSLGRPNRVLKVALL